MAGNANDPVTLFYNILLDYNRLPTALNAAGITKDIMSSKGFEQRFNVTHVAWTAGPHLTNAMPGRKIIEANGLYPATDNSFTK
jgi:hypothetical protein